MAETKCQPHTGQPNLKQYINFPEYTNFNSVSRQLLLDCGIGGEASTSEAVVSQHRALVFCQLKKMLDIVEHDLLKGHLPSVTYLRLDGSVPPPARHSIVTRFNNDPSIDLLLLTTAVSFTDFKIC